jgi:hypothetical protein
MGGEVICLHDAQNGAPVADGAIHDAMPTG